MFAAFVAAKLAMPVAYAFDLGPVFSAFGSSISDVVHRYERGLSGRWDGVDALQATMTDLKMQAERDLRGEGFDPDKAGFTWELDLGRSEAEVSTVTASAAAGALQQAVTAAGQSGQPLLGMRLLSRFIVGTHGLGKRTHKAATEPPTQRALRFNGAAQPASPVHRWEAMNVGDTLAGPAVINGATLTCPVPPGWTLRVDDYGNAELKRA